MQDISVSDRRMLEGSLALIFSLNSLNSSGYSKYYESNWFLGSRFCAIRINVLDRSKASSVAFMKPYPLIASCWSTAILDLIVQGTNSHAKRMSYPSKSRQYKIS
jgi:hypothetical protein